MSFASRPVKPTRWILGAVLLAAAGAPLLLRATGGASRPVILVSAAASLTDALQAVGHAYAARGGNATVQFNFASSGALQQQIEQGAPVDVFASASPKEMDALQREGRIEAGSRVNFASNRLVLIAPRSSRLRAWEDLRSAGVRRVAISDPASVPSGRYAQQTLEHRGLWDAVRKKVVLGENVRQTLAYVMPGDVDAGMVFQTDARIAGDRVRVVATAIPGQDHAPIVYPAAVVRGAPHSAAARGFAQFLDTPTAQAILQHYGFRSASR